MRSKVLWAVLIFLLPALACSLGGGGSESASSNVSLGGDDTEAAAPTEPPVEEDIEQTQAETPTPEPAEPESQPLAATVGMEQFDSFRANMFLEFTGAKGESTGDKTTDQRQDYLIEATKNPRVRHQIITIKSQGAVQTDSTSESFFVDDVTYTKSVGNWIAQPKLMGLSQFANPETFVSLPETAICGDQPEDVNGVSAIKCTFTEQDNVSKGLDAATIQGTVWVAQNGNYVVKYELEAQQVNLKGAFSGGYEQFSTYNLGYELVDANSSDINISLPAEAQGTQVIDASITPGSSGLATPDGAEIFVDSEFGLNYFANTDLPAIVNFHRQQLTSAGWTELADESYVDDNLQALLVFENETGLLRVFVSKDIEGGYFVSITLPYDAPGLSGGGSDSSGGSLPILDDATDKVSSGPVTTYYTASSVAEAVAFYRAELPAQGWTENTATSLTGDANALLTFEKEGATLTVSINQESEGRVNVNLIQQ